MVTTKNINSLTFVEFNTFKTIRMKQGDKTPILLRLGQSSTTLQMSTNQGGKATIYLSDGYRRIVYTGEYDVINNKISFIINSVLPVGTFFLEVDYNGRKYPSDNSYRIEITKSAEVLPKDIIQLNTLDVIRQDVLASVDSVITEKHNAYIESIKDTVTGSSAYEVAVKSGFVGTETEWLKSLGGLSAYQLWLRQGNSGTEADFFNSLKGSSLKFSDLTETQKNELRGKSSYQIWLDQGNVGTESDFLNDIRLTFDELTPEQKEELSTSAEEVKALLKPDVDNWLNENKYKSKEAVSTFSALPSVAELNEIRNVTDENALYIYNGTAWIKYLTVNTTSGGTDSGLTSRVTTLETDVSTAKTNITNLQNDLTTTNSNLTNTNNNFSTLQGTVNTVKSDVTTAKSDITTLKSDVTVLKSDSATAKSNISALQSDVTLLKSKSGTTSTSTTTDLKSFGVVGDGVTDDTNALQNYLNSTRNPYIPEGTYKVTSSLIINKSNYQLDSHPNAWFEWYNSNTTYNWNPCFHIKGDKGISTMQPIGNIQEGSTSVVVKNMPADLKVNDVLRVSTNEPVSTMRDYYWKQEYLEITAIDKTTNTITFVMPTLFSYDVTAYPLTFEKPNFVEHVHFNGINIRSMVANKTIGIKANYAYDVSIKGGNIQDFKTAGVMFEWCMYARLTDYYIDVKTEVDELDYGMIMYYTQYATVANNTMNSYRTCIDITGTSSFVTVIGNSCYKGRIATHNAVHINITGNTVNGFILVRGYNILVADNYVRSDVKTVDQGLIQIQEMADQGHIDIKGNTCVSPENNGAIVGINLTLNNTHNISVVGNTVQNTELGIAFNFGSDTQFAQNITINDNHINVKRQSSIPKGIVLHRVANVTAVGNTIIGGSKEGYGVVLWASAYADKFANYLITNNRIDNFNLGINLTSNVQKVFATNNMINNCTTGTNKDSSLPPNSVIQTNFIDGQLI